jgi:hypothetical protein
MRTISFLLTIGDSGSTDSLKNSLTNRAFPLYVCEQKINANGCDNKRSIYSRSDVDILISESLSSRKKNRINTSFFFVFENVTYQT